ncbi:MBL fold metallo-hydrolase [Clostridium sp.]|uniref:MBL fold metallo-hydrolase n=1 Tax=Clostridium sp. TaxID=1506 RepID=UPI003F3E2856
MILKTLVENKSVSSDFKNKHGICFYIETNNHKILFDLGKNGLFLENANKMGIDISDIDTVIISHGHVDHGGALKLFLEKNHSAKVYIRENAFDKHYTTLLGLKINVGIDSSLKNHPQVVLTEKRMVLDKELTLFSDVETKECLSTSNNTLFAKVGNGILMDDFSHEQSLIISENKKLMLIAGCSHAGIINIKNKAERIVNDRLDCIVGGFHLYNPISKRTESNTLIQEIAERLNNNFTYYYTCHCTGEKAFNKMKEVLSEQLSYLSTGSEIEV